MQEGVGTMQQVPSSRARSSRGPWLRWRSADEVEGRRPRRRGERRPRHIETREGPRRRHPSSRADFGGCSGSGEGQGKAVVGAAVVGGV